jgi:mannose-6-phosphate isomerase
MEGRQNCVCDGPDNATTLAELVNTYGSRILGENCKRFPLLLKFIDAESNLSVQVHPNDVQAARLLPGCSGKSEAWVILDAKPGSMVFAGLKVGTDAERLRIAIETGSVVDSLHSYEVRPGDVISLPAGTVHAIGAGIRLFEIQQSSDVTYRLFDWGRADPKSGRPRTLHIEQAMECIDFSSGPVQPYRAKATGTELLVSNEHFRLWRHSRTSTFDIGEEGEVRVIVGIAGRAEFEFCKEQFVVSSGNVWLLPAAGQRYTCRATHDAIVLECGLGSRFISSTHQVAKA